LLNANFAECKQVLYKTLTAQFFLFCQNKAKKYDFDRLEDHSETKIGFALVLAKQNKLCKSDKTPFLSSRLHLTLEGSHIGQKNHGTGAKKLSQ